VRVMLMALPTRTHIYSLAPLGWALRAAGHEVRYVGQRNPPEVDSFLETGIETMWFGDDLDIARQRRAAASPLDARYKVSETRPEKYTEEYIRTVYKDSVDGLRWAAPDSFLADLLRFARYWKPDLVIWDPFICAGALIAEAVGAAHVRMLCALDQSARIAFQYMELTSRLGPAADPSDPFVDWAGEWLARHGCDYDERVRFGMATLDPSPSCLRYDLDVNYVPVRFVALNRPMTLPRWAIEPPRRPRVLLTLGISNRQITGQEETSVGDLLDGLGDLDAEIIATLDAAQMAEVARVPPNLRAMGFMPMNEVLASCSAIVHQGGGATLCNAAINGVPQLIVPGTTMSERASALGQEKRGYGLLLDLEDVTRATVRELVGRLLDEPSFRKAAVEVQQEMLRAPTLLDIVPDLERLAAAVIRR
jgi:UDP:flavonoid glycosyltransferase YjiC (YdhE family)